MLEKAGPGCTQHLSLSKQISGLLARIGRDNIGGKTRIGHSDIKCILAIICQQFVVEVLQLSDNLSFEPQ
jgi:hypothetical protein